MRCNVKIVSGSIFVVVQIRFRHGRLKVDARRRIHLSTEDENGNFVGRFDSVEYFSRFKLEGRLKFEDERYIFVKSEIICLPDLTMLTCTFLFIHQSDFNSREIR